MGGNFSGNVLDEDVKKKEKNIAARRSLHYGRDDTSKRQEYRFDPREYSGQAPSILLRVRKPPLKMREGGGTERVERESLRVGLSTSQTPLKTTEGTSAG